jgi:alanine racemase
MDTGMNRLGIDLQELKILSDKKYLKNINIKFIMSHFTCAEDNNNLMNNIQLEELLDSLSY